MSLEFQVHPPLHARPAPVAGTCAVRPAVVLVFALCVLAFVLRASTIYLLERWSYPNAIEHRVLALSLVDNGTFYFRDFDYYGPSSVQSPTYPSLLAGLFMIFGRDSAAAYVAAMAINALAGGLTVWIVWKLVHALGGNSRAALIAAALVTIWPSQVYAATHVQAISLITLGTVAIIYLFERSVRTGDLAPWIGYSIIGTLSALTEPVLLPVVALSGLLILFWRGLTFAQRVRNAGVLFAAAMLIIMPWTVRNHAVHGQWVPIKSTFWVNVWKANNDFATGTDRVELSDDRQAALSNVQLSLNDTEVIDRSFDAAHQYDLLTRDQLRKLKHKPEVVREEVFKGFATSWISTHRTRYFELCAIRLGKTIWVDLDNPKSHKVLFWLPRSIMLLLLVPGLIVAFRQRWHLLYAAILVGLCLLTYTLTIAAARFSLPIEPLALCVISAFLAGGWNWRAPKSPTGWVR